MKRFYIIIFCISILCASCVKEMDGDIPAQAKSGATLTLNLDLGSFGMSAPEASTRASETQIEESHIHSCAICIFKQDKVNPSNTRIVGYRVFIDDSSDGHKYFFKNVGAFAGDDGVTPLADVPIADAGTQYLDGTDDSTDENSIYGLNGISADKLSVTATFVHDAAMHGPVENLEDGEYLVIALANFHEEPIVAIHRTIGYWIKEQIKYWQTHKDDAAFDGIVHDPVFSGSTLVFGGGAQILNARVRLYDAKIETLALGGDPNDPNAMYNPSDDDIITSKSYIHNSSTALCASSSMPINIISGHNAYSFEMIRLAARASFTINNHSTLPVSIYDFRLSSNFASAATHLFPQGSSTHNSTTWLGRPNVKAKHAILPFDPETVYAPGTSTVFFDALFASGYDETGINPLSFTFGVGLVDGNETTSTHIDTYATYEELLYQLESPEWETGQGREFCFRNIRYQDFTKFENDRNITTAGGTNLSQEIVNMNSLIEAGDFRYIWILEKVSANTVLIKNKVKNEYLKADGNGDGEGGGILVYTADAEDAQVFTISQYLNNTGKVNTNGTPESIAFTTHYKSTTVFLNEYNNSGKGADNHNLITCSVWCDSGAHFYLYPVTTSTTYTKHKIVTLPVKAFDQRTGLANPLHELERNSHLDVQINVNYNEYTQDLDFRVLPWGEREVEVEFD